VRLHSGPVYLPEMANESGASFGGSMVIASAGSTAWPASVAGNCCWAETSSGTASAATNNAKINHRPMAFPPCIKPHWKKLLSIKPGFLRYLNPSLIHCTSISRQANRAAQTGHSACFRLTVRIGREGHLERKL